MHENLSLRLFRVTTSSIGSRAGVQIACGDEVLIDASASGESATHAAFEAVDLALEVQGTLIGISTHSFSDCSSCGTAGVQVRFGKRTYSGRGTSLDIVEAAVKAYVRAASDYLKEQSRSLDRVDRQCNT